jgi:hypothetical protein
MNEKDKHSEHVWIAAAKQRGLGGAVATLLDALEPIAPLAAQLLWVIQPVAGVFGGRSAIHDLATLLDTPAGVETLRQQLVDDRTQQL